MLQFIITADGTSAAQTFDQAVGGTRRATFRAYSDNWESGTLNVLVQSVGAQAAKAVAGASALTADTEIIPIDMPRGAAVTVSCSGKSGTEPIYVEID